MQILISVRCLQQNFVTVDKHAFVRTGFCTGKVYEKFVDGFSAAVSKLRVGPGIDPDVSVGPLIDNRAHQKVQDIVSDAVARGAEVAVGGNCNSMDGRFFPPTVLTKVTPEMRLGSEEIFGPVAPIFDLKVKNRSSGLPIKRTLTRFHFYSQDVNRCFRVASY